MTRHSDSARSDTSDHDRRRFRLALVLSGAIGAAVSLLLTQTTPFKAFEAFAADVRVSLFGAVMPERDDIVIVAVDEASLARFPFRSPVNRRFLANVARELDERGARVIALDLLLDRPTIPGDDAELAMALGAARADVVLVAQPSFGVHPSDVCAPSAGEIAAAPLAAVFQGIGSLGDGVLCADGFDGVFRDPGDFGAHTSFAEAIAEVAEPSVDGVVRRRSGPLRVGAGPLGSWPFPTYSASQVENLPDEWVRGKIVLVGVVTPWDDLHVTPLRYARVESRVEPATLMPDDMMPGVVVHAYLLAQLLDGAQGPRLRLWREIVLALAAAAAATGVAAAQRTPWVKVAALAGALLGYWLLALFLFAATGMLLGLAAFSVSLIVSAGLAMAANEHFQRNQKRFIRNAFEHYLAPQVVAELIRNPDRLSLAAHEREISVLFADIEAFTRFVDTHDAALVTRFTNAYFDRLIAIIHEHGGTVDKIMGDSVNAFFSAPIADENHRERSVLCALAVDRAAREVTAAYAREGGAPGVTRVGVHSGRALVGNFGGGTRFEYTAQGSTVNLAARLENANKLIGTTVCVSAAVRVETSGIAYRAVGPVRLRGLSELVEVFAPVEAAAANADRLARYDAALALAASDPNAAAQALAALLAEEPDPLVAFQLRRIEAGKFGQIIEA